MSDLIWLSDAQMQEIAPYFPLSHGVPRVDDRRIVSGIIFVIRNGLRWRDAPKDYGPHKTVQCRVINRHTALREHFPKIAIADPAFTVPANAPQDYLATKMTPLEIVHRSLRPCSAPNLGCRSIFATEQCR